MSGSEATQIHWITCCDRQSFELNRISFSIRVKVVCFFLTSTRFSFSVFLSVFIRFIRVCVCFQHYAMHPCSCTTGTSVVVVVFFSFWKTKAGLVKCIPFKLPAVGKQNTENDSHGLKSEEMKLWINTKLSANDQISRSIESGKLCNMILESQSVHPSI